MKHVTSLRFLLAGLVGLAAFGRAAAASPVQSPKNVDVVFSHPEKFTDVKESSMDYENERGGANVFPRLQELIESQAAALLPAGHKLTVTFTDIDLAGDFEPWRGPQFDDIRIVKDIYIPRLTLSFTLTDADGKVVKQGDRRLVDLAFQTRITRAFPDDPLRYEKDMLTDWIRSEFRKARS
ncbi:MAG TPA: DUF3016 domain-containing protein [Lacunisphaera sp.]|nr:DUF3016 domain-containing protein [Lacunisphaera sp.]